MCRRLFALLLSLLVGQAVAAGLSFESALQQAEASAPDLKAAAARRDGAREAVDAADALPDPRAFVGVENLPVEGPGRFSLQRDFMTMQTVGVMQEFPNAGKRRARAEMALAEAEQEDASLALTRSTVRRETAAAWLRLYYLQRQLQVLAALQQDNQTLQQAVEAQVRSGRKRAADALLPRQERLALATRQDEIQRDIALAEVALRRWTGLPDAPVLEGDPPHFALNPDTWREHLHHHPELLRFQPEKDRAQAELDEAKAGTRPDWGGELAYQHRDDAFGDMMSVQVSADLPLFSRTRQTPRIRAKQQQLAGLEAEQEAMLREHRAQLEADIAALTALSRQQVRLDKEAIPLAKEKGVLELSAYRAGTGELTDMLAARQELRELELQQLAVQSQYQVLAASLHYLFDVTESQP